MKTTYAGSERTRETLINATGELAAELGFANVSTRAIARRAEENVGSIHYHFGGKEQLFEAVVRTAIRRWHEFPISKVLGPAESSINTPEGRFRAIRAVICRKISLLFSPEHPRWHSRVIYQAMQYKGPLQNLIRTELIEPDMSALKFLFKSIQPELSDEEAFLHTMILITPLCFHADYMDTILDFLGGRNKRFSKVYLQKMEDILVRQTQLLFGLPDEKKVNQGENP